MQFYATLYLFVDDPVLHALYKGRATENNRRLIEDGHPDSGFDLFIPATTQVNNLDCAACMVNMGVKARMVYNDRPSAFYMFPRSSLSKTPLMLANHTGIIDSGYLGPLIGAFRNLSGTPFTINQHTCLLQICHPSLCPMYVNLVKKEDFESIRMTTRGEDGFGSTGRTT